MNLHANAALSLNRRRQLCRRVLDDGWTVRRAADAAEVSVRCARKWVGRYRTEGEVGLLDRSSAPSTIPHRTSEDRVQAIASAQTYASFGSFVSAAVSISSCVWAISRSASAAFLGGPVARTAREGRGSR